MQTYLQGEYFVNLLAFRKGSFMSKLVEEMVGDEKRALSTPAVVVRSLCTGESEQGKRVLSTSSIVMSRGAL